MSKVLIKNTEGKYLVTGSGFVGNSTNATQFCSEEAGDVQGCASSLGIQTTKEAVAEVVTCKNLVQNPDGSSYAVSFVRAKDLDGSGRVSAHRLNPSKRRFKTEQEARHHGARFVRIEGHRGFYVTKTQDPVNAWVNVTTGKTNPEIGRARVNRD
jgi:hypothetical protein